MDSKIGKIVKFDGYYGEIVDNNNTYMFLDYDLLDQDLKVGDVVTFRSESIFDIERAFFVERYEKNKSDDANILSKNNK